MNRLSTSRGKMTGAFTFVEVFAALVFLAILVPAIVAGLSIANRASVIAERGTTAGELAENKMNEMLAEGTWQSASTSGGNFGADWPGYTWTFSTQTWPLDTVNSMNQLELTVSYPVQGSQRSFSLSTLISGTAQGSTNSSPGSSGGTQSTGGGQ